MTSFNKVILMGNLTRDPEVRYAASGKAVATFAVAVNRKSKQGDETKEEVSYFDIVVFGKQAENCGQYLNKGDSVLIDGKLQQRRWDDKDTGAKRSKVEVAAQSVTFMPKRQSSGGGSGHSQAEQAPEAPVDEGDIPF
jgi:single-strand DNA-binding protein